MNHFLDLIGNMPHISTLDVVDVSDTTLIPFHERAQIAKDLLDHTGHCVYITLVYKEFSWYYQIMALDMRGREHTIKFPATYSDAKDIRAQALDLIYQIKAINSEK